MDTTALSVSVVSSPADGSFVGALRPVYSGTGASGSTWSFTQPTYLSQATTR